MSTKDEKPIWLELVEQPKKSSVFYKGEEKLRSEPSRNEIIWHATLEYKKFTGRNRYDF